MSADNRSTHTDALATLGTIIGATEKRDAIHLGVEPVQAATRLSPGQDVGLDEAGLGSAEAAKLIGIVDPFLRHAVFPGDWFWLVVYPRQITSLRHVWEHPDFPASGETWAAKTPPQVCADLTKLTSEAWLRNFCEENDTPDYETVVMAVMGTLEKNEDFSYDIDETYFNFYGRDAHADIPPEFWNHMEVVTGLKFNAHQRPEYFSCSC